MADNLHRLNFEDIIYRSNTRPPVTQEQYRDLQAQVARLMMERDEARKIARYHYQYRRAIPRIPFIIQIMKERDEARKWAKRLYRLMECLKSSGIISSYQIMKTGWIIITTNSNQPAVRW